MGDFKELYRLYSKQLFNYLLYLTNDRLVAEELVQETFYQAFKSIHRFKGESTIKTWLYQIGKNVYYKYLEKNNIIHVELNPNLADNSTPETIFDTEERERVLHLAIQQLKEPYKQVVILRIFNELSFKEIGMILNVTENFARVTFHRGKLRLKAVLKEAHISDGKM